MDPDRDPHANAWGYGVSMPKFFRILALVPALRGFSTFSAAFGHTCATPSLCPDNSREIPNGSAREQKGRGPAVNYYYFCSSLTRLRNLSFWAYISILRKYSYISATYGNAKPGLAIPNFNYIIFVIPQPPCMDPPPWQFGQRLHRITLVSAARRLAGGWWPGAGIANGSRVPTSRA